MHILLIAPSAPPKNSPEAMQVGRFLAALDTSVKITLVTTPIVTGWAWNDASLAIERPNFKTIKLKLPAHRYTQRILANRRLSFLHLPDVDFWLSWFIQRVEKQLDSVPDVIYSRSMPLSAALLAYRLKQSLKRPWIMHLSDPWFGNPYRKLRAGLIERDRRLEADCFQEADAISLTTEGQASWYRDRYPEQASKIKVVRNMMPNNELASDPIVQAKEFKLVHTGALYVGRDPSTILKAVRLLHQHDPELANCMTVDFYGNMAPEFAESVSATIGCRWHGVVSYERIVGIQQTADALLSIEPAATHPLHRHFLQSKVVDYMARRKPIVAVTPERSEAWRLCSEGHGWAVRPGDYIGLAKILADLLRIKKETGALPPPPHPLKLPYHSETVSEQILMEFNHVVDTSQVGRKL